MTESELYQKELKQFFVMNHLFHRRVEAPSFPDIYVCRNRQAAWIEMKCITNQKKVIRPSWRPGQLAWIREHEVQGGDICWLALNYCGTTYFLKPKQEYTPEEMICQKKIFLMMFNQKKTS